VRDLLRGCYHRKTRSLSSLKRPRGRIKGTCSRQPHKKGEKKKGSIERKEQQERRGKDAFETKTNKKAKRRKGREPNGKNFPLQVKINEGGKKVERQLQAEDKRSLREGSERRSPKTRRITGIGRKGLDTRWERKKRGRGGG